MKQKIKLTFACIAVIVGALSVNGQEAAPAPAPAEAPSSSWVLTPTVVSQYMFRGVRLGGPSFQPALEFGSGSLALGIWASYPIKDKVPGFSDPEIDPYGYYTIALSDTVSLVPGFTWYNYPDADKSVGFYKSTFEPSLALNYTVGAVKFTPKVYYDLVLSGPTYELTAAFAVPLKEAGTELGFSATIGTFDWKEAAENTTPSVKNSGDYWQVGVSAPFAVSKASKIVIGFAYQEGSRNTFEQAGVKVSNPMAVGRGFATVSYSITF